MKTGPKRSIKYTRIAFKVDRKASRISYKFT